MRASGEDIRKLVFDRPLDELDVTEEQRKRMREIVYFEPNPDIRRAVFIASPHRGSEVASNSLGRFGSRLIRLPLDALRMGLSYENIEGTTAGGYNLFNENVDSISTLKPENPLLPATLRLPLGPGVRYHSIIGRKKPEVPLAESDDGLVSYSSAHLDGAASEKIVHATHTSILQDDAAIEEVRRILYLNAGLRYTPPPETPGSP